MFDKNRVDYDLNKENNNKSFLKEENAALKLVNFSDSC